MALVFSIVLLLLAIPVLTAATLSNTSSTGCEKLANLYPKLILFPNSTNYTFHATNFWDKRSDLQPACIFLPSNATQVASAVKIFHENEAHFAIRGGGHMNYPGSNNIDDGILITLAGLTQRRLSADFSTIEVGPGNRWVDVYSELNASGRYAIGGRLKTIGVPGLTLIGGFHYFNNKYGFAMDNVISYDVVLGNGSLITATRKSHKGLFWALKGGSNNFGLVTKFTLKTYPIPQISTTTQIFNESAVPAFITAVCDLAKVDEPNLAAGAVISIQYNATTKEVAPSILGVQEGIDSPPARFVNFSTIPATLRIHKVTTPLEWASTLDTPNQMFRVQFAHHTIKPDASEIHGLYKIWKDAVDQIADVEGLYPTFVLNIIPKSANSIAKNNGVGNIWGLDDDQSWIIYQTSTGWALPEDDLRMTAWSRSLIEHMHAVVKAKGLASEFLYMGDAGEFQDPFATLPSENLQRLKEVRHQYDPDGTFQRLNWGGFKLGF